MLCVHHPCRCTLRLWLAAPCEAPRTRYLTIPWIPRNQLRRRYERCSRKQQTQNVSPGSQVPHKAFFSPNQPSKVSCLLCSVDLLVVSASLRRKIAKRKSLWTKVATDATSKRHKFMKASKRLLKGHVTFRKSKTESKTIKTACCHKPFRSKGLFSPKTLPNNFKFQKQVILGQNFTKLHVTHWYKSCTITSLS